MLLIRRKFLVLLFFPCLLFSCTFTQEGEEKKQELTDLTDNNNTVSELNSEQEAAFDALNTLQVSTDEMNRLYSTFANIAQPCYPPDTSFVITQSELEVAMKQFVEQHCTNLSAEERDKLHKTAVLAQKEYKVLHCSGNPSDIDDEKSLPYMGTWIMPNVLGRRDVILKW